jgi:hypothetical protein
MPVVVDYRVNYNKGHGGRTMFISKKCYQVFSTKQKEHGKGKIPNRKLEHISCDDELIVAETIKFKGRTRDRLLLSF